MTQRKKSEMFKEVSMKAQKTLNFMYSYCLKRSEICIVLAVNMCEEKFIKTFDISCWFVLHMKYSLER